MKHFKKITNLRKHLHETISLVLILMLTLGSVFNQAPEASAATYSFTQSSWSGGVSTNTANHTNNKTGWNQFATTTAGGLVGLWHMNGDWTDSSGNNNNGTRNGTGTSFGTAKLGSNSGSFDGLDDYVNVPTSAGIIDNGPGTIELWFKANAIPSSAGEYGYIYLQLNTITGADVRIYLYGDRSLNFSGHNGTSYQFGITTPFTDTTSWHHVVGVWSATDTRFYLDNVLIGSDTNVDMGSFTPNEITIGSGRFANSYFNGLIDEVAVYNRALPQIEISQRYNSGTGREIVGSDYVAAGSTLALKSTSYTATDDGIFSTTGVATNGGFGGASDGYNKLLLHADGTDGSTTFTDEAGKTVTANGNAQIDTAQSKFGGASGLFDGTGDYLSIPNSTDWDLGAGDFTVDFQLRLNFLPANNTYYGLFGNYISGGVGYNLYFAQESGVYRFIFTDGINNRVWNYTPSTGIWYHIAIVRNGSNLDLYIDGTKQTTLTAFTIINSSTFLSVGANNVNGIPSSFLNGWLDEFRFSKGIARWIANFTPPAVQYGGIFTNTAVSGTSTAASVGLVTTPNPISYYKMDGNWRDSKGTNHGSNREWQVGKLNNALKFDGLDDYVATTYQKTDNSAFSVEAWLYPESYGPAGYGNYIIRLGQFGEVFVHTGGGGIIQFAGTIDNLLTSERSAFYPINLNTWSHFVGTWDGTSARLYLNGTLVATQSTNNGSGGSASFSPYTHIGHTVVPEYGNFDGLLDEVRIYNTALSQSEITTLYNSGNGTETPVSGVAAGWHLNEASGTTATDYIGSNTGTLTNFTQGATFGTAKFGSNSGSFDGVDDYINIGNSSDFNFQTNPFSIELWIKLNSLSELPFLGRGSQNNSGWTLAHNPTNGWEFIVWSAGVRTVEVKEVSSPASTGLWYHLVITRTGTSWKLYENNINIVTVTDADNIPNFSANLEIGTFNTGGWGGYFNGLIDEVAIYNIALSVGEIGNRKNGFGYGNPPYTGTFTSAVIDLGAKAQFDSLSWSATTTASTSISMEARAASTSTMSDATNWTAVTNGGSLPSSFTGKRYFQYKATLSTTDASQTPYLNSVTLNYTQYAPSGALISSKYDTIDATNLITALSWSVSNTSANEIAKFQIRSASSSAGLDSASWCGYSEASTSTCSGNNYFTSSDNGGALNSTHPLRNGDNDQWFQYKVILESAQGATPILSSISIQYVVNASPAFDSSFGTNGISINQIATSTDANWGKILTEYQIKDEDTVTGFASTTFAYRLNNTDSWTSISTTYLNPNTESRIILPAFSPTSTIWNAKSQIGEVYSTTTQIKIILNDLDAANNIGSSTSAVFTLDTKNPLVNSFNIDVSSATTSFAFSDDSNIQYRISNNADFSADTNNKNEWQTPSASSTTFSGSWNFANLPENSRIYYEARDIYGNTTSTSDAVPGITPFNNSALNIKDLSNTSADEWREFISWYPYQATTSAAFGSYQVYRSTDGNNYSLYRTITDSTENFLLDTSVSSSTTYYYKVRFVDSDGDKSGFSAVASDLIDGQGGSDFTAPVISNASSTEVQSTWAKITWTTDELSDSKVEYGTGGSYNSSSTDPTWINANATHTIILSGLSPSTAYNFRVKSKDILNNEGIATGYSFTTLSGASISGVSCSDATDNSITVVWNTDKDASSYVDYSTSTTFASYNSTSPTSLSGGAGSIFQQRAIISGLSSGTKYYIKAKSSANNVTSIYPESGVFFCNTTSDTKPPIITQVEEALISDANAVIVWKTDEPATSQVEYGTVASTTTGNYATSTSKDTTLTLNHFMTLSGLIPETYYYYRVKSWDNNGIESSQTAVSSEYDFKTNVAGQTTVIIYRGGGGSFTPVQEQPKDTTSPYAMNIEVVDLGAFGATVNFDTDEAAKTIVEYGYAAGEYDKNEASFASGFQTKHAIKLSNLKMGTDYHFRIQTVDKSGNIGYSIDQTFTTKYFAQAIKDLITFERAYEIQKEIEESIESILPSILPPFVENPRVTDIMENYATIKWRTNIPAYSIVSYASEKEYDTTKLNPYFAEASDMSEKKTSHEINLIGLTSNTTYNIKVKSFSLPKAVGESKNIEFTTLASKVKARIADIDKDALRVVWTTGEPSTSIVEYKNIRTGEINRKIKDVKEIEHDVRIENLAPDTVYEIKAMGYNEKGNIVESGESITARTSKDVKAPTISNIKIDNALIPGRTDKIQTVISWKTDELATSIVEYEEGSGKTAEELTNKEGTADAYVENHTIILTKLRPGALYKIRVVSTDEANNKSISPTRTIITPRQTESIVDVIVKNFEETFQFLKEIQ